MKSLAQITSCPYSPAARAPFLGAQPPFVVSGAVPMLYIVVQALVEYFPSLPALQGEMELPLSVVDGFTRAYLLCNLIPPSVVEHQSAVVASSPWALLFTSMVSLSNVLRKKISS